jgi:hypothetical protein
MIELETAMNIMIIANIPYSSGVNRLAKTNPIKKLTPALAILSAKLQPTPRTVLLFSDSDIGKC